MEKLMALDVCDGFKVQGVLNSIEKTPKLIILVHGLVGQIPYEMGSLSIDTLLKLVKQQDVNTEENVEEYDVPEFIGTNVLEHLVVPLVLPELIVNENHLPLWTIILGVILLVTIYVTAGIFIVWTICYRKLRVIQHAQPEFLIMVAIGCIVFAASIIPLSMEELDSPGRSAICMSSPWLLCLGFTIIFSALFAKTWRVNHVVQASRRFRRTTLTQMEVLQPFVVLFSANVVVLLLWTILDPLIYTRQDAPGTDEWNRVIATYGQCQSISKRNGFTGSGSLPYIVVLGILNIGVLIVANYQAYQARFINSEFSESNYIGMAMASLLQGAAVGGPVLLLVRDTNPQAWYITCSLLIFFISFGILCLMFVPKIQAAIRPAESTEATSWNGKSQQFSSPFVSGDGGNGSGSGQRRSRPHLGGSNGSGGSGDIQYVLGDGGGAGANPFGRRRDDMTGSDGRRKSSSSLRTPTSPKTSGSKTVHYENDPDDHHLIDSVNDYEIPLSGDHDMPMGGARVPAVIRGVVLKGDNAKPISVNRHEGGNVDDEQEEKQSAVGHKASDDAETNKLESPSILAGIPILSTFSQYMSEEVVEA